MTSIELKIGTRGSQLAMFQARWVQSQLQQAGVNVSLVIIKTEGDIRSDSLKNMGGQGAFTRRIQLALLDGEIDVAVHSLKDLPTRPTPGLCLAAVPPREDHRDALVSNGVRHWRDLPPGSIIGTGSPRRAAALVHLRNDLIVRDVRGNLDTRLKKLDAGQYDGLVLACAGLNRLGWKGRIAHAFDVETMPPAAGQGALGLECRDDDSGTLRILDRLNDPRARARVEAERALLRHLQAGCLAPIGVATSLNPDSQQLTLTATLFSDDAARRVDRTATGPMEQAAELGRTVADDLLKTGESYPRVDDPTDG